MKAQRAYKKSAGWLFRLEGGPSADQSVRLPGAATKQDMANGGCVEDMLPLQFRMIGHPEGYYYRQKVGPSDYKYVWYDGD